MLYAPTLRLIALETRTIEERNRIINSLRGVRSKGFSGTSPTEIHFKASEIWTYSQPSVSGVG